MKECKFCGLNIEDNAQKCPNCLSFQDRIAESKSDIASLIIKFIGGLSVVFTIALTIFGVLGFKSLADLRNSLSDVRNRSEKLLDDTEKKFIEYEQILDTLTKHFNETNTSLNDLSVKKHWERYQTLLDRLVLDKHDEAELLISEIKKIAIKPTDDVKHLFSHK